MNIKKKELSAVYWEEKHKHFLSNGRLKKHFTQKH